MQQNAEAMHCIPCHAMLCHRVASLRFINTDFHNPFHLGDNSKHVCRPRFLPMQDRGVTIPRSEFILAGECGVCGVGDVQVQSTLYSRCVVDRHRGCYVVEFWADGTTARETANER